MKIELMVTPPGGGGRRGSPWRVTERTKPSVTNPIGPWVFRVSDGVKDRESGLKAIKKA